MTISMLFSCQTKSDDIKPSPTIISREQFTRDLFKQYYKKDYSKWQELNELLTNDLISAKKLGILDCRGFDKQSEKLIYKQLFIYNILGYSHKWAVYKTNRGSCIGMSTPIGEFFLSANEARVLLSASQGYHFEKLGFEKPTIIFRLTIFKDSRFSFCGDTTSELKGTSQISSNACQEMIFYNVDIKNQKNLNIYHPFSSTKKPLN